MWHRDFLQHSGDREDTLLRMRRPREHSESESSVQQQKMVFDLGHPCNALSLNKDGTLLAAAGRKVFKILKLSPDQMEVQNDLRDLPHKQLNLNYSSNDVHWNPNDDSKLASAPTNGSVVLWDINKKAKNKLTYVYENEHLRAVNKLSFHPKENNILLSGSQDFTMKIFDTRVKSAVQTFKGTDCVRDVKFPPFNDHCFASCFDNGSLQTWDRRYPDNPMKVLTCHSGPAYCCAWHPDNEHWIMSAGRDKMIKVHDLQLGRAREVCTVPALSSVARVKWRPGHKHHITSCSLFLDNVVAIWDVRRPYIPFASFTEHFDDVTDFVWLNENVLLSSSKDCKLVQQVMSQAERPADKATPVGLSFCPDGGVAHACSDSISHRSKATSGSMQYGPSRNPMSFRKTEQDPYQQAFLQHNSSLKEYKERTTNSQLAAFVHCANNYRLKGQPLSELCDHNYKVSQSLNLHDISQSWLILKFLYCERDSECHPLDLITARFPPKLKLSLPRAPSIAVEDGSEHASSEEMGLVMQAVGEQTPSLESGHEENEEEGEEGNSAMSAVMDFFEDDKSSDLGPSENMPIMQPPQQRWESVELPAEPFRLRHDILMRPASPDHDISSAISTSQSQSAVESSSLTKQPTHQESKIHSKSPSLEVPFKRQWNFQQVVAKMLKYYAEQGDVQMSVSVLLVLGERGKDIVDDTSIEHWFSSYIDLLMRQQLWCVATQIIKDCPLEEIRKMSQESTTYHTMCNYCNKSMESGGWQCHRCYKLISWCSVCHRTVRGLFVWCQVCGHGGHLQHLKEWYRVHQHCPSGCGHNCVASGVPV